MAGNGSTESASSIAAARTERWAARLAVIIAVALTIAKVIAWRITGSHVIFSDALEGCVNVVASLVALWAISHAHRPADRSHPYGHGRFELLSAALEGGMIAIAAAAIMLRSVDALLRGEVALQSIDAGLALLVVTVVVNGAVGGALRRIGRRGGSPALAADGMHLLSDAVTTLVAISALLVVRLTGWTWIDPASAIVVAIGIGVMGVRVVRRALGDLVDEQDPRDAAAVESILASHCGPEGLEPRICSWHALRVRHVGREHWIDFHMMVPAGSDVRSAHAAASAIEHEIERRIGPGDATAHIEPCEDPACGRCRP